MTTNHTPIDDEDAARSMAARQAENNREQTALYRDTMATEAHQSRAKAALGFARDETVEVHAFGHWYTGTVVKATAKTVTVRYTSGSGVTRNKTVPNPTRPDRDGLDTSQVLVRVPHPHGQALWIADAWRIPAAHDHTHAPVDDEDGANGHWLVHLVEAHGFGLSRLAGYSHAAQEVHSQLDHGEVV